MDSEPQPIKSNKPQPVSWKKLLIVIGVLILAIGIPFLVHRYVINTALNFGRPSEASGETFQVLSEPPETATVGEEYLYYLRVGQFDSPKVYVTVTVKPEWLSWDAEKLRLYGTPEEKYVGQNFVVIKATDTNVTKEQAFSIYVDPKTTGEVQGAQDGVGRVSDEEIAASQSCQRYYQQLGPLGVIADHPECEGIFYGGSPARSGSDDSEVLGVTDTINDFFGNSASGEDLPTISASQVDRRPDIFGLKISSNLGIGLIASLAVIIVGLIILFTWMSLTGIRINMNKGPEKGFKFKNIGNQKEGRQQSFIDKNNDTQVIIWD